MKTIIRHQGDVVIVDLLGEIDMESTKPFRDQFVTLLKQPASLTLLFNLRQLKFVGSSGLSSFIHILKEFNGYRSKPRFCHVGADFKKLFRIYSPEENFLIFSSEDDALSYESLRSEHS